jgi:hypothetical protein
MSGQAGMTATRVSTMIGILLFLIIFADFYVAGGIPAATQIRDMISLSIPWAAIITVAMLLLTNIKRVGSQTQGYHRAIIILVTFAITFVLGLAVGTGGPEYGDWYTIFSAKPNFVLDGIMGLILAMGLCTRFKARNIWYGYMLVISLIAFFTVTLLGELIFPGIIPFGKWMMENPVLPANNALWIATYLGLVGLLIRVFTFKQSLGGGAG